MHPRMMTAKRFAMLDSMAGKSFADWEKVIAGDLNYRGGLIDCSACKLWLLKGCHYCPIMEYTGKPFCNDTPAVDYKQLHNHYIKGNWDLAIEVKVAAEEQLKFLHCVHARVIKQRLLEFVKENR